MSALATELRDHGGRGFMASDMLSKVPYGVLYRAATAVEEQEKRIQELEATLQAVVTTVDRYEGWHIDSPEDSWRFERDIRAALGLPEASND